MASETAMVETGTVQQEIEQLVGKFAGRFSAGDLAALASLYAKDAEFYAPGGATLHGRAVIEQFWRSVRESGVCSVCYEPHKVEARGESAYEWGTIVLTAHGQDGAPHAVRLRYAAQWRRSERHESAPSVRWTRGV